MEYAYPPAVETSLKVTYVNVLNGLLCCPSLTEPQVAPPLITDPTEMSNIYAFSSNLTTNLLPAFKMETIAASTNLQPIAKGVWYRIETMCSCTNMTLTFQPTNAADLFYIYNNCDLDLTNVTFVLNGASPENIYIISDSNITTSLNPMYGNFICKCFYARDAPNSLFGTICASARNYSRPKRPIPQVVTDALPATRQPNLFDATSYVVYVSSVHMPTYTPPVVTDPYIPVTTNIPVYNSFYSGEDVEVPQVVLNKDFGTEPLYMFVVT
jgi:hypothetical protein